MMPSSWNLDIAGQPGFGPVGPSYAGTSTTNLPIATGPITVTTQPGLAYLVGARIRLSSNSAPTQWMEGLITAYSGTSMSINIDTTSGSSFFNYPNITGFINKFRNPTMDVAQRGTSGTTAASNYTLDGWRVVPTVTASWSQVYNANLSGNALRINCASGQTTLGLRPRIESWIAAQLLANNKTAQPVTVQFTIFNNTGAAITPQFATSFPTVIDNFAAQTNDLLAVNAQTIPNGAIGVVAYTFVPSASIQLGMQVDLEFGAQLNAASGYVDISYADIRATPGIPVGLNNSPPPPEMRPVAQELAWCMRYYQSYSPPMVRGAATGSTVARMGMVLPVPMRATPTTTLVSGLPVYNGQQTNTVTSITPYSNAQSLEFDGNTSAAWSAYGPAMVYLGAGGQVTLSAEL